MTESEERTRYLIEPEYKKSAYDEQIWNNTLKNGKPVSVKVGNLYRWGSFYIELTDIQKEDLLKKESVLLNDYEEFELIEMWDGGCDFWVDIVDEDDFTEEELKEINALLYSSQENEGGLGACPQEDEGGLGACPQEDNGGLGACPQEDKGGLGACPQEDKGGLGYPQEEKMEANGWCETDCEYTLSGPYKLDKVEEND